jgi:hypothetical protein
MTSDSIDTTSVPEATSEDERRARAAEMNRKRTEEEWNHNKREWVKSNFPDTTGSEKK